MLAEKIFDAVNGKDIHLPRLVSSLLRQETDGCQENGLQMLAQQHPLGFLYLRWNLDEARAIRVHIWDKAFTWTQNPNWPIHDHIFGFTSAVLLGQIQNKTYEIASSRHRKKWCVYEVNYFDQSSYLEAQTNLATLKITSSDVQSAGSYYELPAGILHRSTLRSDTAITVLATNTASMHTGRPRVIGQIGYDELAFSRIPSLVLDTNSIVRSVIHRLDNESAS